MLELIRRTQLESVATDQLDNAFKEGCWFAVIFSVKDGILSINETTCDFPTGDLDKSLMLMRQAIDKKLGVIPSDPLPLAPHLTRVPEEPAVCGAGEDYYGPAD